MSSELEGLPGEDPQAARPGAGVLKAEYTDFITYQGTETFDASGNEFYRTPQFSGTIGADLTFPVSAGHAVGLGTDWIVRSLVYHNAVIQDDPVQETPACTRSATPRRASSRGREGSPPWGYVKNLTDTDYKVLSQVVNGGAYPTSLGNPRTFGLQLSAQLWHRLAPFRKDFFMKRV